MSLEMTVFLLDLAGTSVFAITGGLAAIQKRMDIFGVAVLAFVTALGGGTMRDMLLGQMPPFYFENPWYFAVTLATALVVFAAPGIFLRLSRPIMVFDAIGLGVFTVIGAEKALSLGFPAVPVIVLGMLTGIGGGVLRDLLRSEIPLVLRKEIYASASLLGALTFVLVRHTSAPASVALLSGMIATVAVRLLAVHYGLGLPVRKIRD